MDRRVAGVVSALSDKQRELRQMEANVPDPVEQRRIQVRVADDLRNIADLLDDNGYLTE